MSYPGLIYDTCDMPTEKQNEHIIHKAEGAIFTWCEYCREEDACPICNGNQRKDGGDCIACEGSGRKI